MWNLVNYLDVLTLSLKDKLVRLLGISTKWVTRLQKHIFCSRRLNKKAKAFGLWVYCLFTAKHPASFSKHEQQHGSWTTPWYIWAWRNSDFKRRTQKVNLESFPLRDSISTTLFPILWNSQLYSIKQQLFSKRSSI